jgi:hypothetical protein
MVLPTPFRSALFLNPKITVVGATIEYRLPWNLSVEADGLFRELHMTLEGVETNGTLNSVSPAPVVTWEFPMLGKYRFHWSRFDSFVEAGPAFCTTGNLNAYPSHDGVAAGVGVDLYWRVFDIAPVLRYTRWAHDQGDSFAESIRQAGRGISLRLLAAAIVPAALVIVMLPLPILFRFPREQRHIRLELKRCPVTLPSRDRRERPLGPATQ